MNSILSINNLSIGYTKELFCVQDLELECGQLVALIGENGAGKSTLLRTISGIQNFDSGKIEINGNSIIAYSNSELAKVRSVVLSQAPVDLDLTVLDLLSSALYLSTNWFGKISTGERNKMHAALEMVNLIELSNRKVVSLSDGERQRALIARALVQDTPLIIMDEPTAHLDINNTISILSLLRNLTKQLQKTIIFSTHNLNLAIQLADQFLLIKDQKLIEGYPEELILKGVLQSVFESDRYRFSSETGEIKVNLESQKPEILINLVFTGTSRNWYKQLFQKAGIVISEANQEIKVEIASGSNITVTTSKETKSFSNIKLAIQFIQKSIEIKAL